MKSSVIILLVAIVAYISAFEIDATTNQNCAAYSGLCYDTTTVACSVNFRSGLCPGPSNIRCCLGTASFRTPASTPSTSTSSTSASVSTATSSTASTSTSSSSASVSTTRSPCLPTLANAKKCYVQGLVPEVKKVLGGNADASYITNTCAMKMSNLMNCNAEIANQPQCAIKRQSGLVTVADKNGQRLALRVRELLPVLKQRLGKPTMDVRSSSRGIDMNLFKGKAGVVVFDTTGAWNDATGHMSVLTGDGYLIEEHLDAAHVARYFKLSVRITFWEM